MQAGLSHLSTVVRYSVSFYIFSLPRCPQIRGQGTKATDHVTSWWPHNDVTILVCGQKFPNWSPQIKISLSFTNLFLPTHREFFTSQFRADSWSLPRCKANYDVPGPCLSLPLSLSFILTLFFPLVFHFSSLFLPLPLFVFHAQFSFFLRHPRFTSITPPSSFR